MRRSLSTQPLLLSKASSEVSTALVQSKTRRPHELRLYTDKNPSTLPSTVGAILTEHKWVVGAHVAEVERDVRADQLVNLYADLVMSVTSRLIYTR